MTVGFLRWFRRDEAGATAIEYALIAGLIFLAIVSAINLYTDSVSSMYNKISSNVVQ